MKTTIFIFILLLIAAPLIIINQVKKKEQIGTITTYSTDADYAMGVVFFESKNYSRNYEKDRIYAIERLRKSAKRGFAPAQFYLGEIYHSDPLIFKQAEGVKLLKKASYQNDQQAINYLNQNKIPYESKPKVN
jgi:TPR repeat protein